MLQAWSLQGAGTGVDIAYYLVHSMGRGRNGDYRAKDREGASNFSQMARREGIDRVVYLGGLGDEPKSDHLRSRHETAQTLAIEGPPLTYLRAAMVVGAGSESYRTLRYLVERLPAMIAPAWLKTKTQPIAVDDVLSYMEQAPHVAESAGARDPDRRARRAHLRRHARPHGRRARPQPPAEGAGAVPYALAVLALDRLGHAGRCRRRAPVDRGAVYADRGDRSVRRVAVRRQGDAPRRRAAPRYEEDLAAA